LASETPGELRFIEKIFDLFHRDTFISLEVSSETKHQMNTQELKQRRLLEDG
jgi:hypothetical protein